MGNLTRITALAFSGLFAAYLGTSAQTKAQWEDISPGGADRCGGQFGFQVLDGAKTDARKTLYVGTCGQGVWKTTTGGDSWIKASTGTNGDQIASGRNWSLVVDWSNSNIVYTVTGFGNRQGIWKSTNGGVDWGQIQNNITQNDISHIEMDPLNHQHILVTEHSGNFDCWETVDGGNTWVNKGHPWGGANTFVYFLGQDNSGNPSSNFWIGFAENNGLWRTENGGSTWIQVSSSLSRSHAGAGIYRAVNGALFGSVNATIGRSTDNGRTWVDLRTIGNLPVSTDAYAGIVGDGTTIYTMRSNTGHAAQGPYHWTTTPEAGDGRTWTDYNSQSFEDGPQSMIFDPVNGTVYGSNWCAGLFRLKVSGTTMIKTAVVHPIGSRQVISALYDLRGKILIAGTRPETTANMLRRNATGVRIASTADGNVKRVVN